MPIPADYFTRPVDAGGLQQDAPVETDLRRVSAASAQLQALVSDIMDARSRSGAVVFTAAQKTDLRTAFNAALVALKDAARVLPTP